MFRLVLCALVILPFVDASAHAQPAGHPAALTLNGGAALPRSGQATRVHLLGQVEFYSLALYVDGAPVDRARLLSADVPKALRIEVRFKEDFRRAIAIDWRRELIPRLEPAAIEHLRQAFAPLQAGDVVLVEYVPGKGTTLRVNKAVAVTGANHDLMLAFLDHWLGQTPISEEIKRALLGSSQARGDPRTTGDRLRATCPEHGALAVIVGHDESQHAIEGVRREPGQRACGRARSPRAVDRGVQNGLWTLPAEALPAC